MSGKFRYILAAQSSEFVSQKSHSSPRMKLSRAYRYREFGFRFSVLRAATKLEFTRRWRKEGAWILSRNVSVLVFVFVFGAS